MSSDARPREAAKAATAATAAAATSTATAIAGTRHGAGVDRSWLGRNLEYLFLAYLLLYPLPWLWGRAPTAIEVAAFALGVAVFLPLYFASHRVAGRLQLACVAGVLLVGFALQPFNGVWSVFAVYSAAMAAYLRPFRRAVYVLVGIGLAVVAFALALRLPAFEWGPAVFFGALVGVSSLYQARVEAANRELAASREEARRLAVVAERERIARDLHDVLGHTLTVVAVKADLAGKLVERDPAAARREIEEIRTTARRALADLRAAVTGMRSATLAAELAGAREALASAGIAHEVSAASGPLPAAVETALAYVLREAVTNVVRHAEASQCRIALTRAGDEALLEVRDDGRGGARPEGNGIAGMRLRLAPLGGRLEMDGSAAGTRVLARVPLPAVAT
jgi:two-component system sensor histidine kinase DesK